MFIRHRTDLLCSGSDGCIHQFRMVPGGGNGGTAIGPANGLLSCPLFVLAALPPSKGDVISCLVDVIISDVTELTLAFECVCIACCSRSLTIIICIDVDVGESAVKPNIALPELALHCPSVRGVVWIYLPTAPQIVSFAVTASREFSLYHAAFRPSNCTANFEQLSSIC
jgi:hypothetical protein